MGQIVNRYWNLLGSAHNLKEKNRSRVNTSDLTIQSQIVLQYQYAGEAESESKCEILGRSENAFLPSPDT